MKSHFDPSDMVSGSEESLLNFSGKDRRAFEPDNNNNSKITITLCSIKTL